MCLFLFQVVFLWSVWPVWHLLYFHFLWGSQKSTILWQCGNSSVFESRQSDIFSKAKERKYVRLSMYFLKSSVYAVYCSSIPQVSGLSMAKHLHFFIFLNLLHSPDRSIRGCCFKLCCTKLYHMPGDNCQAQSPPNWVRPSNTIYYPAQSLAEIIKGAHHVAGVGLQWGQTEAEPGSRSTSTHTQPGCLQRTCTTGSWPHVSPQSQSPHRSLRATNCQTSCP